MSGFVCTKAEITFANNAKKTFFGELGNEITQNWMFLNIS